MTTRQKQLILCCFDLLPLDAVDGVWGRQSESATRALQHELEILEDGIFGNDTATAAFAQLVTRDPSTQSELDLAPTGTFWDTSEFFIREEFRCQCGGRWCNGFPVEPSEKLVQTCNEIRRRLGVPISIIDAGGSGVRCATHNANVGGVANSNHLYGNAADLHSSKSPEEMARVAEEVMGSTGEIGIYSWGIHVGVNCACSRFRG